MGDKTYHEMLDENQAEEEGMISLAQKRESTFAQPTFMLPKRVRHVERGTSYVVIGTAKMQCAGWVSYLPNDPQESSSVDGQEVVVYESEADGSRWVRPVSEFMDGRFDPMVPASKATGELPIVDQIDKDVRELLSFTAIQAQKAVSFEAIEELTSLNPWVEKVADIINRPEVELTEDQYFMIEAAEQIAGIETIDDNANTYVVTREQIVKLMETVRDTTKAQTVEARVDISVKDFIQASAKKASQECFAHSGYVSAVGYSDAINIAREAAALAVRERIESFKVNEFIDDQIATLLTRFDGIPHWQEAKFVEQEIGELAREAVLRVIMDKATLITNLANDVHGRNVLKGWWNDVHTGEDLHGKRNIGELLALAHSELTEADEAKDYAGVTKQLAKLIGLCTLAIVDIDNHKTQLLGIHSALDRALEGWRKSKMDDKLPHRPGFRVELMDAFIRLLDTLGSEENGPDQHPAGTIFVEKMQYNAVRPDHMRENRLKADGKKI